MSRSKHEFLLSSDFNSAEQLQHLLIARQQDIQRLSQELHQLEMETTEEKDALYRRLALKEAERDRANIQLKNTQELLGKYNLIIVISMFTFY